jgi:hypothetical protein
VSRFADLPPPPFVLAHVFLTASPKRTGAAAGAVI